MSTLPRAYRELLPPLLAGLLLRTVLMLAAYHLTGTQIITQGDTASYLQPGQNLFHHGAYATAGLPEIDRTPGYPIFLMLTGMLTGNVLLSVTVQIAVSIASLLLIYRIANQAFPNRQPCLIAAWLYALEPISILSTVRLMPETLFVLLLLAFIERLLTFQKSHKLVHLAVAGVFLATATYVRPVSYYLVIPLALALVIIAPKTNGYRWKAPLVLLLTTLPLLAVWQVRNWIETGYSGFSSIVEKNLYFYQSAEVTAELQHISLGAEQKQLGYLDEASYIALHPDQRAWTQSQRLQYMHRESLKILNRHRLLYLKTHVAGVAIVALTPCATEFLQLVDLYPQPDQMPRRILNQGIFSSMLQVFRVHPIVALTMAVFETYLLFLYLFAIRAIRKHQAPFLPLMTLIGIALYFLLISGGAQAVGRYRVPVIPELCILAAGGLAKPQTKRDAEP